MSGEVGRPATWEEADAMVALLRDFEPVKVVPKGYLESSRENCSRLRVVKPEEAADDDRPTR